MVVIDDGNYGDDITVIRVALSGDIEMGCQPEGNPLSSCKYESEEIENEHIDDVP